MKHLYIFLSISFSSILLSCSNTAKQENTVAATAVKAVEKTHKHRHRPIPDGTLSLDIIEYQGKLHMLTGTHQKGVKVLWYQVSDDQGVNWSSPVDINNGKPLVANLTRGNDARLAVQGNHLVAIWASRKEGAPHNAGPMQAARSADGGKTWQNSTIPADWTAGAHAFFAMSGNDEKINAVWLDSRHGKSAVPGSQGLRFSQTTDGGETWSKNTTLDNVTCACCWNTAKFDSGNNFYVLYRDKQPTDMAVGTIKDQQQWQRLSSVGAFNWDFPGCPHIGGGLAFQNNDQLLHSVVGTGHTDHLGVYYLRSTDGGKTWGTPVQLGDESAIRGDIAASEDGRVVAVWDMRSEDGLSIFYSESKDYGLSWSAPNRLSKSGLRATHPRIVAKSKGFLALWTESKTGKLQSLQMQSL